MSKQRRKRGNKGRRRPQKKKTENKPPPGPQQQDVPDVRKTTYEANPLFGIGKTVADTGGVVLGVKVGESIKVSAIVKVDDDSEEYTLEGLLGEEEETKDLKGPLPHLLPEMFFWLAKEIGVDRELVTETMLEALVTFYAGDSPEVAEDLGNILSEVTSRPIAKEETDEDEEPDKEEIAIDLLLEEEPTPEE